MHKLASQFIIIFFYTAFSKDATMSLYFFSVRKHTNKHIGYSALNFHNQTLIFDLFSGNYTIFFRSAKYKYKVSHAKNKTFNLAYVGG